MGNACDSKPSTTSTEKVQLVYWNLHGRSDFCQAMLYAGGVPYDLDEETANVWPEGKDATPFGQIPVLKHGSLTLAQGGALTRYCARLGGLYPEDMTEASICDMYLEEVMDIYGALFKVSEYVEYRGIDEVRLIYSVTDGQSIWTSCMFDFIRHVFLALRLVIPLFMPHPLLQLNTLQYYTCAHLYVFSH